MKSNNKKKVITGQKQIYKMVFEGRKDDTDLASV